VKQSIRDNKFGIPSPDQPWPEKGFRFSNLESGILNPFFHRPQVKLLSAAPRDRLSTRAGRAGQESRIPNPVAARPCQAPHELRRFAPPIPRPPSSSKVLITSEIKQIAVVLSPVALPPIGPAPLRPTRSRRLAVPGLTSYRTAAAQGVDQDGVGRCCVATLSPGSIRIRFPGTRRHAARPLETPKLAMNITHSYSLRLSNDTGDGRRGLEPSVGRGDNASSNSRPVI
jgi:hypothetical protein